MQQQCFLSSFPHPAVFNQTYSSASTSLLLLYNAILLSLPFQCPDPHIYEFRVLKGSDLTYRYVHTEVHN
jgi:hypothetical protein